MSELKTLVTCNPREFLMQTNRIKDSLEKWLTLTDVMNIRKRAAALEMVPQDGTMEERAAVFERNKKASTDQAMRNLSAMWDAISKEHPDETLELMALCCFIEPVEIENYQMRDVFIAFNSLIKDRAMIDFFTSLASLVQINTSNASRA